MLAVIVIGGFVGAGGLGYLVIVGQSKPELAGKGLAAGLAIVLLGVDHGPDHPGERPPIRESRLVSTGIERPTTEMKSQRKSGPLGPPRG